MWRPPRSSGGAGAVPWLPRMLARPWKVPLLNATDCIISFCVVLLVTTSTLYLNEIDETMYGFASAVSTVMLSSIGGAIGIMFLMTGSALFYRSAMGGKKELKFFNLGSVPQSDDLAKKVKEMVGELEAMEVAELSKKLNALAVFDISKLTTCITLLATEVAPPAQDAYSFKFNKRIASSSFDPALKRKQQTLRQSHSKEETKVGEADNALVESDETTQQSWM